MFWLFIAATTVGLGFFKLGALSVWVSVLSLAIELLLIALLGVGGYAVWQRHKLTRK